MDMEQIKRQLIAMSPEERDNVSAILWHLKHANDPEHRKLITDRLNDKDPSHWLSLEEVKRRLGMEE